MIGKELVKERDLTLVEVKDILGKRKEISELSFEQKQTFDYVSEFSKGTAKKSCELVEKLQNIGKIDQPTAVLIANLRPADKDDLRVLLEKKRYDLSEEEIKKLLNLVADY